MPASPAAASAAAAAAGAGTGRQPRRQLLQSASDSNSTTDVGGVQDWKGYDLLRGGTAEGFVPDPSFIGRRYIAGRGLHSSTSHFNLSRFCHSLYTLNTP